MGSGKDAKKVGVVLRATAKPTEKQLGAAPGGGSERFLSADTSRPIAGHLGFLDEALTSGMSKVFAEQQRKINALFSEGAGKEVRKFTESFEGMIRDSVNRASKGIAADLLSQSFRAEMAKFGEDLAARLATPESKGWIRLSEILDDAQNDPLVMGSPVAAEILQLFKALADNAYGHWTTDEVLQPWIDGMKAEQASKIASMKNAKPRAWVLSEWANRTDKDQKKAEFARVYVPLVKKKFRLTVQAETIARDWLPRSRKGKQE